MKGGYLGIDESNNGRFPEIFVGVYSDIPWDIRERSKWLEKLRPKSKIITLEGILGNRDFRYIMIPKEYSNIFTQQQIITIAYSEFMIFYSDSKKVIVDGAVKQKIIEDAKDFIKTRMDLNISEIVAEPHADERYMIVNVADAIANLLMRQYSKRRKRIRETINEHFSHIITPKYENYGYFFKTKNPPINCKKKRYVNKKIKPSS